MASVGASLICAAGSQQSFSLGTVMPVSCCLQGEKGVLEVSFFSIVMESESCKEMEGPNTSAAHTVLLLVRPAAMRSRFKGGFPLPCLDIMEGNEHFLAAVNLMPCTEIPISRRSGGGNPTL